MAKEYRHELKYYINRQDYELLSSRLSLSMERDRHVGKSGEYFLRSLYFDDTEDTAFRGKLSGIESRDKYRVRIYNMGEDSIKLERKHKQGNYILKDSLPLIRSEYDMLYSGCYDFLLERREPFARQMYAAFKHQCLKPKVIVDYTREPFVFSHEDVRVTFDKNLHTAMRRTTLFDKSMPTYPVLEEGTMVLEIKFNKYLSSYIRMLLACKSAQRSAISKYCLCRKFEL